MQVFNSTLYIKRLVQHYKNYFEVEGRRLTLDKGPKEKLHPEFLVLEVPPNERHSMFTYCTVGMSADRMDNNLIELFIFSPIPSNQLVEVMTYCASYHRNKLPLNIHHTVNIGPELELFKFEGNEIRCYWFIPITQKERDCKIEKGCEALEQLFEEKQFDYLNPDRKCLIAQG